MSAQFNPEISEGQAEHAYWQFDARRKGYAEWSGAPQSERDAFKAEYRAALAMRADAAPVAKEAPPLLSVDDYTVEMEKIALSCLRFGPEGHKFVPSEALAKFYFTYVVKEATRDAETPQQANVLPPFAAPAGQQDARDPNWLLSTMDGKDWADEFCRLNNAADHGMMLAWFCNAIMTGYDTGRRREAEEQLSTAGSAKGGITNTEAGTVSKRGIEFEDAFDSSWELKLATTTSTVSAPAALVHVGTLAVYEDSEATFGHAYDISTNMAGHKLLQGLDGATLYAAKPGAEGAQKAPEDVRDAVAWRYQHGDSWEVVDSRDVLGTAMKRGYEVQSLGVIGRYCAACEQFVSSPCNSADCATPENPLRTSSTDQANADTGSAE